MSKIKTKEEFINEIVNDTEKVKQFPNIVGRKAYANALWELLETALLTDAIKHEILQEKGVVEDEKSESNVGRRKATVDKEQETSETEEN